jgi:hypothetical protein
VTDYREWPDWATKQALALGNRKMNLWKDAYFDLERQALANEGQLTQIGYPFDAIVLAKMKCDAAGDDPHLFMRYFGESFAELEKSRVH